MAADVLSSALWSLQSRVPFEVSGSFDDGSLSFGNFPVVEVKDRWVYNTLLEEVYKVIKGNRLVKGIRFLDPMGKVVVEVRL